ncbi:MAG: helix-turn-helix domain-containing protein [Betaproteobacteria bacterium]|nr:helix-turn-helix domain-containing protein [Betaproteobacteria bacterium]
MELDPQQCFDALRSRDRRFDGRFFVGVSSTGVYCRPICAVRTPRPEHCHFFPSAAAADKAGYRPCLRCRPELAPGWGLPDIPGRLAQAAALLIEQGFLDHADTAQLAARVGVSARHLRRLFRAEYGVSMLELAQTQRLLLAKQCLTQTTLPVSEVALACGFRSLRRFHAVLAQRWGLSAQRIRRGASARAQAALELVLPYRPPLDWSAWLEQARALALPGVERVEDRRYARTLRLDGPRGPCEGWVQVRDDAGACCLRVRASVQLAPAVAQLLARLRRMFDLGASPAAVEERLGELARGGPGMRVPGAPDGFETLVRALVRREGAAAPAVLACIARRFAPQPQAGALDGAPPGLQALFPRAQDLAGADEAALLACGMSLGGARALLAAAAQLRAGLLDLQPWAPLEPTVQALQELAGMDGATPQWVAMQALGWPDAFPAQDPALQLAAGCADADALLQRAQAWRPWRAYAAMYLARQAAPAVAPAAALRAPARRPQAPAKAPANVHGDAHGDAQRLPEIRS